MVFVIYPTRALRDICPCTDKCQTRGQCVNISGGIVNAPHLACQPVVWNRALFVQVIENNTQQARMIRLTKTTEIRYPADIPE